MPPITGPAAEASDAPEGAKPVQPRRGGQSLLFTLEVVRMSNRPGLLEISQTADIGLW